MDAHEARKANFRELLKAHKTLRALAEATESDPGHLSQVKNNTRELGAEVARRFEAKLGLPHGWMDRRDHTSAPAPSQSALALQKLIADFNELPPLLQDHIAEVTADLRTLVDGVPTKYRPAISAPPSDPESYEAWERSIRALGSLSGPEA